jgi:hypothetical protein
MMMMMMMMNKSKNFNAYISTEFVFVGDKVLMIKKKRRVLFLRATGNGGHCSRGL